MKLARENATFFGHIEAQASILRFLEQGKVPHGLLFSGPQGVGKATFAFRLARFLLSQGPQLQLTEGALSIDEGTSLFKKVAAGSHGDLWTLSRQIDSKGNLPKFISVEEVRRAIAFSHKTPFESYWRVIIVDSADDLNKNAANGLLKLLEEPAERMVLMLISSRPGRLPATVRSRCQRVSFGLLSSEEVHQVYEAQGLAPSFVERLSLARGRPGFMMQLDQMDGGKIYQRVLDFLLLTLQGQGRRAMVGLQSVLDRAPEVRDLFMNLLLAWGQDLISYGLGHRDFSEAEKKIFSYTEKKPLVHWGQLWQRMEEFSQEAFIYNLDWRQTLEGVVRLFEGDVPSIH